jgi:chromate transporter
MTASAQEPKCRAAASPQPATSPHGTVSEVFLAFLHLGLTSFGGPIAHLGYFRAAFVVKRRWLSDADYADLVALCQFLPGPASSQVGIGIGLARAGLPGALAAWLGFTLPSALAMTLFGIGVIALGEGMPPGLLHGLEVAVVAVVAHALAGMARTLCPDATRVVLALVAGTVLVLVPRVWAPLAVIAAGAVVGLLLLSPPRERDHTMLYIPVSQTLGTVALGVLGLLLLLLPVAVVLTDLPALALADTFLRTGAMVFGGGHVVLPLLQAALVQEGAVQPDTFLAGYGAVQAVPGPLFTFAAFLGAVAVTGPGGWTGAGLCLTAIFLPSFLLVVGALPFWSRLRDVAPAQQALAGINAAVVGLLLAAFIDPVCVSGIRAPGDLLLAVAAWALLASRRAPPWAVVALAAAVGHGLAMAAD